MSPVLASIVMPSLNQREFIGEAIRSVFDQGLEGVELIVRDGGSSDGTQEVLSQFAAAHPGRLRWTSQRDDGPAQAVNRAVQEARGELVGWLNSDDLYAPGSIARAIESLRASPDMVMIYGEGEHVDVAGAPLGRYPTLPPWTPLEAFEEGCFICQPTAFFRRRPFLEAGGLDESLRAAFDFDVWMRLFRRHPRGIGYLPQVQALSRLHAGGITLRERERVAIEGMTVLHRHLGHAPPEWLMTHFAERAALHPFNGPPTDFRAAMLGLVDRVAPLVTGEGERRLRQRLLEDASFRTASTHAFVPVYPDGWAGPSQEIRLRQPESPARAFVLRGRHARPGGGSLRLRAHAPDGRREDLLLEDNGRFAWEILIDDRRPDAHLVYRIETDDAFVPARWSGGDDWRELAFLVEGLELLPA